MGRERETYPGLFLPSIKRAIITELQTKFKKLHPKSRTVELKFISNLWVAVGHSTTTGACAIT